MSRQVVSTLMGEMIDPPPRTAPAAVGLPLRTQQPRLFQPEKDRVERPLPEIDAFPWRKRRPV
jgi:hypothetical protein